MHRLLTQVYSSTMVILRLNLSTSLWMHSCRTSQWICSSLESGLVSCGSARPTNCSKFLCVFRLLIYPHPYLHLTTQLQATNCNNFRSIWTTDNWKVRLPVPPTILFIISGCLPQQRAHFWRYLHRQPLQGMSSGSLVYLSFLRRTRPRQCYAVRVRVALFSPVAKLRVQDYS